jgi:hypothetical protein
MMCFGERRSGAQRNILKNQNGKFANPVRAGFDQFFWYSHT